MALAMVAMAFSLSAPNAEAAWTNSWSTETALGAPAAQSVVVSGLDGTVYVMGGVTDATYGAIADAYAYDPDSGDWTVLASMPAAVRGAAGAVGVDGKVYVFGGAYAGVVTNTQIYDPETDSWDAGTALPLGVWEAKAATVGNGSIWVVGGESAGGISQIYDPVADTWSVGPSAPESVMCGSMIADGDNLYYAGGGSGGYSGTTNFFMYDGDLGSWASLTDLPEVRAGHAMVMGIDGLIYLIGGSDSGLNWGGGVTYDTVIAYDPVAEEWMDVVSLDNTRTYLGATMTADGRIMAIGGNTDTTVLDVVESLQLYLFDYSIEFSSTSVRAGESVLMTVDPQLTYIEEYYSDVSWYLVSDVDGTLYNDGYMWNPTDAPMALEIYVSLLAEPGDYIIVVEYLEVWGDGSYDYVEMLEFPLEVLPAATPVEDLISDLEAQISALETQVADLQTQLDDLSTAMDTADADMAVEIAALQTQVAALEESLAALEASMTADNQDLMDEITALQGQMDEITALQDQIALLQDSLDNVSADVSSDDTDNTMNYVVIVLVIIVILLLVVMMLMRPKSVPPPPVE